MSKLRRTTKDTKSFFIHNGGKLMKIDHLTIAKLNRLYQVVFANTRAGNIILNSPKIFDKTTFIGK